MTGLVIVFTLHNMEEAIFDLPKWMADHQVGTAEIDRRVFQLSLACVSATSRIGLWWLHTRMSRTIQLWVAALFAGLLLANIFSNAGLSIWTCSQMPGLLSAMTLTGPISWLTLVHSRRKPQLRNTQLTAIIVIGLVAQTVVPWIVISMVGVGIDLYGTTPHS